MGGHTIPLLYLLDEEADRSGSTISRGTDSVVSSCPDLGGDDLRSIKEDDDPSSSDTVDPVAVHSDIDTGAPAVPETLPQLLRYMANMTARPLASFSADFEYLQQQMVPTEKTAPLRPANRPNDGEVYVPRSHGAFIFTGAGIEIEGALGSGVDVPVMVLMPVPAPDLLCQPPRYAGAAAHA